MKKKPKLPVMYMIVCIYMIFSAFDLMEDSDISWTHKLSYVFLILIPLGVTVYSVWQRNVQSENGAFAAIGWCFPTGLASVFVGAGLAAFGGGAPGGLIITAVAAVFAAIIVFFGVNRLKNLRAPAMVVCFDLPPEECLKIEKRCGYERFPKISVVSAGRSQIVGLLQGNSPEVPHAAVISDPGLVDDLKRRNLLADQAGEDRKEFPAFLKDPDGQWTGILLNPVVIAVDSRKWKKNRETEAQPIRDPETLLSPNLVGAYAMPDAEKNDAGRVFLASLIQNMGEEEGRDLYARLLAQAGRRLTAPIDYRNVFADGDIMVAVGFLRDVLPADSARRPLTLSFPEGAGWEMSKLLLPKNSPDPDLSKSFVDFVASKRGNEVLALKAQLFPGHPKALVPPGSPPRVDSGLSETFVP